MARAKSSMSVTEKRKKKKECEQRRRDKLKSDPLAYAQHQIKEKERYLKKKEMGVVKPIGRLSVRGKLFQRKKWRGATKRCRAKKLEEHRLQVMLRANTPSSSEGETSSSSGDDPDEPRTSRSTRQQIVLTPALHSASSGPSTNESIRKCVGRKRVLKNRSQLVRDNALLKKKLEQSARLNEKYRKKLQRSVPTTQSAPGGLTTPRSRVKALVGSSKVSCAVKRRLLMGAVLEDQMAKGLKETDETSRHKFLQIILSGGFMKKYKVLKNNIFIKYKQIWANKKRSKSSSSFGRLIKANTMKQAVAEFLEQDDNSKMCPGKKDFVTRKKVKKQKRLLCSSLRNLYQKFTKEHSNISYALFCRFRPFWIVNPSVNDRETCRCVLCSNFNFVVNKLHNLKVVKERDSIKLLKEICCHSDNEMCLFRQCAICVDKLICYEEFEIDKEISYPQWKTVKETYTDKNGQKKTVQKTKLVEIPGKLGDLITTLETSLVKFMCHQANQIHQYLTMKTLKQELNETEALIHIDFSENFCCKYAEEVQSLHFGGSRQQITLHTGVMYVRNGGEVQCESFCSISDSLNHSPPAIWAHLDPVLERLSELHPTVHTLHFMSDGPATQYRNKTMFHIISKHLISSFPPLRTITWNFSESGHGKGAPDGIGGTIKRTADRFVAMGRNIPDYKAFVELMENTFHKIRIYTVSSQKIEAKEKILAEDTTVVKPFVGTMKCHQVSWQNFSLSFRTLSCFACDAGNVCCHYGLSVRSTKEEEEENDEEVEPEKPPEFSEEVSTFSTSIPSHEGLHVGDWVSANYDGQLYPGEILEINGEDYLISVMISAGGHKFKWPATADVCSYALNDIKKKLGNPIPTNSRMCQFHFANYP